MRDDKTGTDEERNTPDTARTIPTRRRKEPEPPATDEWRPPASLNPWARAFDGDSLPDEPYMGSNKKPKQFSDMLPDPDPARIVEEVERPQTTPETMR